MEGSVLDFGCGAKPYVNLFCNCTKYVGLDINKSGHDHKNENIDVFYDGEHIPFDDESFDNVFSSEVFEHIAKPELIIPEIKRVLKKGGYMLVTVPFVQKAYEHIEKWRCRPLTGNYAYVYVDGVYLKRSWGGEIQNVSVLVAIGVNQDGYREILGAAEGMKEDHESWLNFFLWLKERGLSGVRLFIGDKNLGMLETINEVFPESKYQRCIVHFYRNVFSVVPRGKVRDVAMMLKAIHSQESKEAARQKAEQVAQSLRKMKLKAAAKKVEDSIEETLTFMDFPSQHWTRIRTNNTLERLNREIKKANKSHRSFPGW